jgi:hypothetical protein
MSTMETLKALCVAMKDLQTDKETVEASLAAINMQLDDLRLKKIPEMMEQLDLRTATFEGLGRVQLAADLYASTRAGQKEAALLWLKDCGYADMIQASVNSSSLKALFRRLIMEGGEIPETIFNIAPFTRASIVKA